MKKNISSKPIYEIYCYWYICAASGTFYRLPSTGIPEPHVLIGGKIKIEDLIKDLIGRGNWSSSPYIYEKNKKWIFAGFLKTPSGHISRLTAVVNTSQNEKRY